MRQLVGAVAVVLLSLLVWLQSRRFPEMPDGHPGPGLFPTVVAIALFLSGLLLMVSALRHPAQPATGDPSEVGARGGIARISIVVLTVAAYPFAHELLGFLPTVSVICFVVALLLKARPASGVLTAVGGTVVIYLLFTRVLGVPL